MGWNEMGEDELSWPNTARKGEERRVSGASGKNGLVIRTPVANAMGDNSNLITSIHSFSDQDNPDPTPTNPTDRKESI